MISTFLLIKLVWELLERVVLMLLLPQAPIWVSLVEGLILVRAVMLAEVEGEAPKLNPVLLKTLESLVVRLLK